MSRLNIAELAPEMYKAFLHTEQAIQKGPLHATIRELVKIRSSQLNGCVFCIDMHVHEALRIGEAQIGSTSCPPGGSRSCTPTPSEPRWPTPRPPPSSPTVCRTRSGTR